MKLQTLALAAAVAASGLVAGQAFAQDRDVTITHERPNGAVVTKHIVRTDDGRVRRVVRVERPDGTTVIRRSHGYRDRDRDELAMHRTVIVRHRAYEPTRHVVVRTVRERPAYVVNRRVTVIHDEG